MNRPSTRLSAHPDQSASPDRERVVLDAAVRAASLLGFSQAQLSRVLGIDASTLSRRIAQKRGLSARSREYEMALLLVRLFRSLSALAGGQDATARAWLASPNLAFGGQRPRDLMVSAEGFVRVLQYLDAHRATV